MEDDKIDSKINKTARRANHFGLTEIVSSEKSNAIENISLYPKQEPGYMNCHPVPLRGASAIVTNEGRVAVDAGSADKRTA
jgi:hypothetical protein